MFALGREDRLEKECGVVCSSSMADYDDVFSRCGCWGVKCESFHEFEIHVVCGSWACNTKEVSISIIMVIRNPYPHLNQEAFYLIQDHGGGDKTVRTLPWSGSIRPLSSVPRSSNN